MTADLQFREYCDHSIKVICKHNLSTEIILLYILLNQVHSVSDTTQHRESGKDDTWHIGTSIEYVFQVRLPYTSAKIKRVHPLVPGLSHSTNLVSQRCMHHS
jgi:hypothetical protein